MDIELTNVNPLPSLTWRWLGLNGETFQFPNVELLRKVAPRARVQGMQPGITLKQGKPANFPAIQTAAGAEAQALVESHAGNVQSIRIAAGEKLAEPLILQYTLLSDSCCVEDTYIYAEAGSEAQVVMSYSGSYEAGGLHLGSVKLYAEAGAKLELVQLQALGRHYVNMDDVGADGEDGATISVKQLELGARKNYYGARMELTHDHSEAKITTHYLAQGDQFVDVNYLVNIWGKKTNSTITSRGLLLGRAKKNLRGTLDFKRGSKGSVGNESEEVLLLDKGVQNKSLPIILCAEEDIEGNHSASIGELDEAQLYYLRTRGLSDAEIRRMQLASKFALVRAELPAALHEVVDLYEEAAYSHE